MDVDFVVQGFDRTVGLSRYSGSLLPELRNECDVTVRRPRLPEVVRRSLGKMGDAETFFSSFPLDYEPLEADVLHVTSQTMGVPLLYRDVGPTVVTVHDIFPYIFDRDTQFDPIEPLYERGLYRLAMRALKKADHIIAISDATKRTLQEYLDIPTNKITRVYYGVDHETFRPMDVPDEVYERYGLNPEDKHILYVGSERPRKAVPELIEAFTDVVEEVPDATLVKVGGPELPSERERVEAVIRREDVGDSVVFTGHVEDDLPLLYNLADIYASSSYYEGFGLPFVEAMACGTPVVGRNQSAMPEVIGDGGELFESNSNESLIELLVEMLTNKSEYHDYAKAARQKSEQFSWEKTAVETLAVYRLLDSANCSTQASRLLSL